AQFEKDWWGWWRDINPSWRKESEPMDRGSDGPWKTMDYHGQNGFLNVLMGLKWWRDAMPEGSKEWDKAVEDVIWVLTKMRG
ncbi:hypothetical protein B0H19DRAFT_921606, partial [Mycena capillaripes]